MKRTLSLILAVVMVALMIPFAAIVTSATDDASSEIVLPENWRMSADDGAGVANAWDENGVTLGSAGQYVQMTTTEGMGIGTKRVLVIDYGVATKVQRLRIAWEPDAETAPADSWHNGSDIDLLLFGGPSDQSNGEDAKTCIKMCTGTSYTWKDNGRIVNVSVTKKVGGELTTTTMTKQAWKCDTETDFMNVLFDGANKGTGTKMMVYFDIDENNKITAIHQRYVYHDADGNFVSDIVLSLPITLDNVVVCDGYLTITHFGWGGNCAATVKAVDVYAGTYAAMGESIYSADFKKVASLADTVAATELTKGEASYNENAEGIRFTTAVDADDFQTLVDLYDEGEIDMVEFGTLITTEAWADAAGAVTFAALDTAVGESGKTAYVAVMATIGDFYDGLNTFAGSIGNAKAERTYVAVGFAKVTVGEDVFYVYSAATTATLASVQG